MYLKFGVNSPFDVTTAFNITNAVASATLRQHDTVTSVGILNIIRVVLMPLLILLILMPVTICSLKALRSRSADGTVTVTPLKPDRRYLCGRRVKVGKRRGLGISDTELFTV